MSILPFITDKLEILDQCIVSGAAPATLRGHIIEMRDHIAAANERDLTTELEILRGEFRELTSKCASLEAKNRALESQFATSPPTEKRLHDDAVKILRFLFTQPDAISTEYLAQRFGLQRGMAQYHLDELVKRDFAALVGIGPVYVIDTEGNKYVAEQLQ